MRPGTPLGRRQNDAGGFLVFLARDTRCLEFEHSPQHRFELGDNIRNLVQPETIPDNFYAHKCRRYGVGGWINIMMVSTRTQLGAMMIVNIIPGVAELHDG